MGKSKGFILLDGNVCYVKLRSNDYDKVKVDDCFVITPFRDLLSAMTDFTIDEFFSALLSEGVIEEAVIAEGEDG